MIKALVIFVVFLCLCAVGFAQDCDRVVEKTTATPATKGTRAQGSITTMFAWNGGYAGNTFDITGNIDFYCDGVDVNWMFAGETINVDMYYKIGTAYGYEGDPSAWTLLGTNSATASGPDLPTFIDLQGNGVQFAANQEMGCAVHVNNYAYLYGSLGYTKGTWIFSNNDITELETHHGLADPPFGSTFYPRCWNGTFYYNTSGAALPFIDVKCNGEDSTVEVHDGANCTLTLDVTPRDFAGYPAEIWVLGINRATGIIFTYGEYPAAIWLPGVNNFLYGGDLIDISETCLDQPLPIGSYEVYGAFEFLVNGQLNLPFIYKYDVVDFSVIVPPTEYKWDSGTTNNLLCWVSGGDIVGMHCFDTIPGGENLTTVGTIFGSALHYNYAPGNGTPTDFYIWEATSFGDPTNASLLTQGTGVVGNVDTDIHYWDAITCTITTPNFYLAYNLHHGPYEYCLSIDNTNLYVNGAAFYTGTNTMYGFDPVNLYANQYPPAESPYGFWTVRAEY